MKKLSDAQFRALSAVAAAHVYHMHPFTWVIDLVDLDHFKPRTLETLARRKLIRVVANSGDVQRPVVLTGEGDDARVKELDARKARGES